MKQRLMISCIAMFDQSIVLPDSRIGELSIFARRSADMCILAVMSAGPARTVEVPLSFLGAGSYQGTLVRGRLDDPAAVTLANKTVQRSDSLAIEMTRGGGFVGCLVK